jgi:hypothetical protein
MTRKGGTALEGDLKPRVLKTTKVVLAAFVIAAYAASARAQVMGTTPQQQADLINFQGAMAKAQAAAMKPGDEVLACPAIRHELVTVMDSPPMKAYAAKANATTAQQVVDSQKKSGAPMSPATAAALAQSLSPQMGGPAGMAGLSGMPTAAQMAQAQKLMVDQMKQMTPVLPALMRAQRLMMLSGMKQCG